VKNDGSQDCPFCCPDPERIFHQGELVLGFWDGFPVSPGHALLVIRRHVASLFDATEPERAELMAAVDIARHHIERRHEPAGYNVGVNVGEAGGQTVAHLHLHVIPRYQGDVRDPRGGVRNVIPVLGNYLATGPTEGQLAGDSEAVFRTTLDGDGLANGVPHDRAIITGELGDPLLSHVHSMAELFEAPE
jgi:diadenosine tetraphosphate (Ap4A) HIT family hydrolase